MSANSIAGTCCPSVNAMQTAEMAEMTSLRQENGDLFLMYEEAQARINTLTVEVEIARLEFEQVFDAVGDATWVISTDFRVLRVNRAFLDLLGLTAKSEVIGRYCHDLMPSEWCGTPRCPVPKLARGGKRLECDVQRTNASGQTIPYLMTVMPLYGLSDEVIGIVEQWKDISHRKRYEEALEKANAKLKQLAAVDGLTQLANRRTFDERLALEWRRMQREKQTLALVMCDIDYFKRYNDHYGHRAGDECLQAVASCFKSCLRRPADLAARYGGEEFAAILPNTSLEGARFVAERIRAAVEARQLAHAESGVGPWVTLSLGVAAASPEDRSDSGHALIEAADARLYRSKEAGRNRVTPAAAKPC
jgi:diguanylate cyclase (GGDEF)-like protein/PAS domain S-box-containing protein